MASKHWKALMALPGYSQDDPTTSVALRACAEEAATTAHPGFSPVPYVLVGEKLLYGQVVADAPGTVYDGQPFDPWLRGDPCVAQRRGGFYFCRLRNMSGGKPLRFGYGFLPGYVVRWDRLYHIPYQYRQRAQALVDAGAVTKTFDQACALLKFGGHDES